MATVTKQWGNGDPLTLVTSAGGIAVTSAENLTGADREMTIRVQTTNQGTKAFQDVLIKQSKYAVLQDGYWVHKDTGVTTYFGADADFINNGVMSRPDWIVYAKEIRLCSGITEFEVLTITISDPDWGDYVYEDIYVFSSVENLNNPGSYLHNDVLEKLDFGNASVEEIPSGLLQVYSWYDSGATIAVEHSFKELVLNENVERAYDMILVTALQTRDVTVIIPVTPTYVGGNEWGPFFSDQNTPRIKKFIIKTPYANVTSLSNLFPLRVSGNYIIEGY